MTFPDSQIIAAIESAPPYIRDYIRSGNMALVVAEIGQKNKLHIDTIGTLAALTRNMLVGLMSPVEVLGELSALGMPEEISKKILAELNEQIFKPIREQAHIAIPDAAVPQQRPLPPQIQIVPETRPTPVLEASASPIPVSVEQNRPVVQEKPAQSPTPESVVVSGNDVLEKPHVRTMAEDMALVKAGIYVESQHKEEGVVVHAPKPVTPVQPAPVQPAPIERPPVSEFPPPRPAAAPRPQPHTQHASATAKPAIKSYGVDPYREPIE
jgi:hypothetical protein